MAPLLSGVGGTFSLRLEKTAEIEAVTKTWQCPLTRRVLPRLVFGRSPNLVTTGTGRFDGKIVTAVEFPKLPYTRPLNSEAKQRLADWLADNELVRSEEHTSELQSLMRNSYAVFCLKKKNIVNSQEQSRSTHS